MKSHTSIVASLILVIISSVTFLICYLTRLDTLWQVLAFAFFVISAAIALSQRFCPHCKRFGIVLVFTKKSQYCRHCGELIEFE